jgi:hypothetical protein
MAAGVTKKDLQSLQATFSKQIADLKEEIGKVRQDFHKGLDAEKTATAAANKDLAQRLDNLEAKHESLSDACRTLASALRDLVDHYKR